jgi:hypothetical protein
MPPALARGAGQGRLKINTGSGPREKFELIAPRRGRNIAKLAVAREILTCPITVYAPERFLVSAPRSREPKQTLAA